MKRVFDSTIVEELQKQNELIKEQNSLISQLIKEQNLLISQLIEIIKIKRFYG